MLIVVRGVHRVVDAMAAILGHIVPDCEIHLALLLSLPPLLDFTNMSMSRFFVLVLNQVVMIRDNTLLYLVLIMTYLLEHMKVFVRILLRKVTILWLVVHR